MSDSDKSTDVSLKSRQNFPKRMILTAELIDRVAGHPCLWDRQCPDYRDRVAKDMAWKAIYMHFEPEFESLNKNKKVQIGAIITKKWYNVRDSFRKSLKSTSRNTRPYIYSDRLQFLEHEFSDEVHSCKEDDKKSYIEERLSNDEGEILEQKSWLNEVFVDYIDDESVDTAGAAMSPTAKRPKLENLSRVKETHEADESIVAVLANLIQKEEDEDRAFFKSITPSVKSLSERSKYEFRIQVMKLINTLKGRDRKILKRKNTNVDSESE